jgi:hypothetical protein
MSLTPVLVVGLVVLGVVTLAIWQRQVRLQRERWIREFAFPRGIFAKVIAKHPGLAMKDMELVSRGLRQFFLAYLRSGTGNMWRCPPRWPTTSGTSSFSTPATTRRFAAAPSAAFCTTRPPPH